MNNKLYQAKNKNKFMETLNDPKMYVWLFDKTFEYEQKFGKDLYNFSKDEILEFLSSRKLAITTLQGLVSYISTYIGWAIKDGVKRSDRNPTDEISIEDLKKIAKKTDVLDAEIIYELAGVSDFDTGLPKLKNAQDKLLIYLLFLGINGERANEIVNLKFEHVDIENGVIKLSELDPTRKDMRIDPHCLKLFKATKKERYYERYLDEDNIDDKNSAEDYEVIDSDYVFRRSAVGRKSNDEKISYSALIRRINAIREYTGIPLTIKKVERAGMIRTAQKILEKGLELTDTNEVVIRALFERYNIKGERNRYEFLRKLKRDIEKLENQNKS